MGWFIVCGLFVSADALLPSLPTTWIVEDHLACFIVKDRTGQALAHIYYEDAWQPAAAKLLSRDEARRIAANIAKLPNSLRK